MPDSIIKCINCGNPTSYQDKEVLCDDCKQKIRVTNESYCNGCKYITWMHRKDTDEKIGGACCHPELLKINQRTTFTGVPKEKPKWCAGRDYGKVMHIDTLAKKCGYFNGQSPVNNGYGCNHIHQEDQEKFEGKDYGRCIRNSCPIATPLSPNEYEEDRKYFEGDDWKNITDGDWLLVHGKFRSEEDPKQQQFLEDTKKLIDKNTDLEVALSRIDGDQIDTIIEEQIANGLLCSKCLKYIDALESESCDCNKENED